MRVCALTKHYNDFYYSPVSSLQSAEYGKCCQDCGPKIYIFNNFTKMLLW